MGRHTADGRDAVEIVDDDDDAGIVDRREQVFLLLILLPDKARFGEQADIGVVVGLRGLQIAENGGVVLRTRKDTASRR